MEGIRSERGGSASSLSVLSKTDTLVARGVHSDCTIRE
ncbi:hypothetical protein SCG7086_AK_00170 [Chlamydiales bacterium SCGC AG-110-P3]|nr:hypothetical protein SCG7086_AK_00170 [Chlamydiales bacterium SCGC AG-110-P3]